MLYMSDSEEKSVVCEPVKIFLTSSAMGGSRDSSLSPPHLIFQKRSLRPAVGRDAAPPRLEGVWLGDVGCDGL